MHVRRGLGVPFEISKLPVDLHEFDSLKELEKLENTTVKIRFSVIVCRFTKPCRWINVSLKFPFGTVG
jgi:hypothetical protein